MGATSDDAETLSEIYTFSNTYEENNHINNLDINHYSYQYFNLYCNLQCLPICIF